MAKTKGELRLTFRKRSSGKTYIAKQFYKLPLQITIPYYQDDDGTAFLMLLNMGGGVFGGDHYVTDITVEDDARVLITNVSATKIYKALEGDSSLIENVFSVGEKAVLEYMPECCIPYRDSDSCQKTEFRLRKSSFLFATDFVTPGRLDMGEKFSYRKYISDFRIYVDDRLIATERAILKPEDTEMDRKGIMEGHNDYVSVFIYSEDVNEAFVKKLNDICVAAEDIRCGASMIDEGLAVVKMLGDDADIINDLIKKLWHASRMELLGKPGVGLRKM